MITKSIAAVAALGLISTAAFADGTRTGTAEVIKPTTEVIQPKTEVTRPKGGETVRAGSGSEVAPATRGR